MVTDRAGDADTRGIRRAIPSPGSPHCAAGRRLRSVRLARQIDAKHGAHSGRALHVDLAVMETDNVLHDREPETRPALLARASLVDAIETLEDAREIGGGNAGSRVLDFDERTG